MRGFVHAIFGGFVIALLMQVPASAAEEVICGRILGLSAPTASADGSLVIPQPGDVAPAGTYVVIRRGTAFAYAGPPVWVCVRTTKSPPTQVMGGHTSTLTFIEFVQPGAPGYRPEPSAIPRAGASPAIGQVGTLPSTGTAMQPPGRTEVSVCGRLSAFSAPSASRPQGGIAINRDGTLVEYKVAGAGTVTPANITGLGTAMTPVTVRFSGALGSDGVVTAYTLTQVASCQGITSLPGTATSGYDTRWLLFASGVFGMAILTALCRPTGCFQR